MTTKHILNRDVQRTSCWITFILISAVFMLQLIIMASWNRNQEQRQRYRKHQAFFRSLMCLYAVFLIDASVDLALNYGQPSCHCDALIMFAAFTWPLCRCITYYFMLQRARMSQGISAVVSKRCFEFRIPLLLFVFWIFDTVVFMGIISTYDIECISYGDLKYCQAMEKEPVPDEVVLLAMLIALIETCIAAFLLYLFIKPLCQHRSTNQSRDDKRILKTLKWNVSMSVLNMTSTIIMLAWNALSLEAEYFWPLDRLINIVSAFAMLGRNRQWIKGRIQKYMRSSSTDYASQNSRSATLTAANFKNSEIYRTSTMPSQLASPNIELQTKLEYFLKNVFDAFLHKYCMTQIDAAVIKTDTNSALSHC